MNKLQRYLIGLGLILSLIGCNRTPDPKELKVIKEMTGMMRTHCVGRYLIDLPENFIWNEFPEVELYYGLDANFKTVNVQIVDGHSSPKKFEARVLKRINSIAADKNRQASGTMLLERRDLGENQIFIKRYKTNVLTRSYTYEVHQLIGDIHISLKANSFPEDTRSAEKILVQLTSQLQLINKPLEQQGPGFCLGPVLIDAGSDNEILINHFARDKNQPDIRLRVYMNAMTPDAEERLPEQLKREQSAFEQQPKMLRTGQTRLGAMNADEALMRFEENATVTHVFVARSTRPVPSLSSPSISMRLHTGGEISSAPMPDPLRYGSDGSLPKRYPPPLTVSSSLTTNEAIGLWDAVLKSVRLRPNAIQNTQ